MLGEQLGQRLVQALAGRRQGNVSRQGDPLDCRTGLLHETSAILSGSKHASSLPRTPPLQARSLPETMISRLPTVLLLALTVLVLAACSRGDRIQQAPAEILYERGIGNLDSGNYRNAIGYLEMLEARFPFSNQARQAQLDLIYAYFRNGDRESALDRAQQFVRENPTHPRVDYALYMQGLINFERTPTVVDRWLRVDLDARPPQFTLESFSAFQQLVQRFPSSEYVPDAIERMAYLRNRLAAYEIAVARFYMQRGAYAAALNRARYMIETYPEAPQTREALEVQVEAYDRLGLQDLAADTRRLLEENFPGTGRRGRGS
ncbi:MAG: outer membrane protein assembly factor BamD [Gammaproteobacteria bacterium]|nr:MAG: outer membrane protein assembly factor BamD [Gammaproteobacteria bacterium]